MPLHRLCPSIRRSPPSRNPARFPPIIRSQLLVTALGTLPGHSPSKAPATALPLSSHSCLGSPHQSADPLFLELPGYVPARSPQSGEFPRGAWVWFLVTTPCPDSAPTAPSVFLKSHFPTFSPNGTGPPCYTHPLHPAFSLPHLGITPLNTPSSPGP